MADTDATYADEPAVETEEKGPGFWDRVSMWFDSNKKKYYTCPKRKAKIGEMLMDELTERGKGNLLGGIWTLVNSNPQEMRLFFDPVLMECIKLHKPTAGMLALEWVHGRRRDTTENMAESMFAVFNGEDAGRKQFERVVRSYVIKQFEKMRFDDLAKYCVCTDRCSKTFTSGCEYQRQLGIRDCANYEPEDEF